MWRRRARSGPSHGERRRRHYGPRQRREGREGEARPEAASARRPHRASSGARRARRSSSISTSSSSARAGPSSSSPSPSGEPAARRARTRARSSSKARSWAARRSVALGPLLAHVGERRRPRVALPAPRQQAPQREARQVLAAAGEGEGHVLVEARELGVLAAQRLAEALLLARQALEAGAPSGERELGVAQVLAEQQRALLQRVEHAVGVGADQGRHPIEQSKRHRDLLRRGPRASRGEVAERRRARGKTHVKGRGGGFTCALRSGGAADLHSAGWLRPPARRPASASSWSRTRRPSRAGCATCSPSTATSRPAPPTARPGCARASTAATTSSFSTSCSPGGADSTSAASSAPRARACPS